MRIKNKVIFCLLGGFLLATSIAFAQDEDRRGSKDHPLISRFPGSIIKYYDVKQFDEYILPLGKVECERNEDYEWVFNLTKSKQLEGKITRITYEAPEDRSTLEIYHNYESAFKRADKRADFEILFTGAKEEGLGKYWASYLYKDLNPLKGDAGLVIQGDPRFQRYLSAKLSRPENDVYVTLYVSIGLYDRPMIQLDVIEIKPMETGLVTINADALAKDIDRTGHVAIYGIHFDTGKAEVKPESEPILKEIAKLLQQNPELKLYVVGHTDNVDDLTYNMKLSQDRADAVVTKLVSEYSINAKRLEAQGVGFLAPVASNKTDEGRAKNRRVELVEQ